MVFSNPLFEISWEVCNKIGGIHTVISSKAKFAKENFNDYFVLGPYRGDGQTEFIESNPPENFQNIFNELQQIGIKVHFGKWEIDTRPTAILIEYMGYANNINEIKAKIWDIGKVDSLNSDWYDFDEVMLWSWCCGIVIDKLSNLYQNPSIIHAHEWMSGGAVFYAKSIDNSKLKTIFTTHATMLGRALSGRGENLYDIQEDIDPEKKAIEVGVKTKHQTERALAKVSDAFTTVSQITGCEADVFYKKRPDFLLYNGFDNPQLDMVDNFYLLYEKSREKINEFLYNYFKRFYDINLDNTEIFFTSGRNEFRTKGIDILTKSLSKLNDKLKQEENSKNIVALYLIPIGQFKKDETLVESINNPDSKRQVDLDYAALSTHDVGWDNEYIKALIKNNLKNHIQDKVKTILVPVYLDGNDGLINMHYYDTILGLDLGIFASYYEPWGYTPLECISYGVPTITTNLAGFGRTVLREFQEYDVVKVLDREKKTEEEIIEDLTNEMYKFSYKTPKELYASKTRARVFSNEFNWSKFYQNYINAYQFILKK